MNTDSKLQFIAITFIPIMTILLLVIAINSCNDLHGSSKLSAIKKADDLTGQERNDLCKEIYGDEFLSYQRYDGRYECFLNKNIYARFPYWELDDEEIEKEKISTTIPDDVNGNDSKTNYTCTIDMKSDNSVASLCDTCCNRYDYVIE